MKVLLDGYFDHNFGDDYMMKIMIHLLPELDFLVELNEKTKWIAEESNVKPKFHNETARKLIITGSGFMINSFRAFLHELKWFVEGKYIADYCVGCNIEHFHNPIKEYLIQKKLQKFKLIICRDKKSYGWLKDRCNNTEIHYFPDILFFMPDKWIVKSDNGNKLGISMLHRSGDKEDCQYYKTMAKAADYWIKKTNENVYLLAFNTGSENDVYACECVKNQMQFSHKTKIIEHKDRGEIINAYAECKKIIGARFHSAVLAMKMDIDFFPIVYRNKMKNLIDDVNYPNKGCYIDHINYDNIRSFIDSEKLNYKIDENITLDPERYLRVVKEMIL